MIEFQTALASPDQPGATYVALARLADRTIGARLFTLMEIDAARGVARRTYSSMPDTYPVLGEKPIEPGPWLDQVGRRHRTFVANSIEEITAVFSDHSLIQSIGCGSCLNLPVVIAGEVVGTLNCLHEAGHYTPERVAGAESLRLPGALAFLLAKSIRQGD